MPNQKGNQTLIYDTRKPTNLQNPKPNEKLILIMFKVPTLLENHNFFFFFSVLVNSVRTVIIVIYIVWISFVNCIAQFEA